MALSFDILTIFPGMFSGVLGESMVARAIDAGLIDVELTDIRDFSTDRHQKVDDRPYGGGPGMVFKPEPVVAAAEHVLARGKAESERTRRILLTPQGKRLEQRDLRELAEADWIVLLCGHYEGMDERIQEVLRFEEFSIGDYVLTGGELPAMVVLDGVSRLVPGVLGHPDSAANESFENGLLDCPHYTRPFVFRDLEVPEVLISGDHRRIAAWRREQSLRRTRERRGDLLPPEGGADGDTEEGEQRGQSIVARAAASSGLEGSNESLSDYWSG